MIPVHFEDCTIDGGVEIGEELWIYLLVTDPSFAVDTTWIDDAYHDNNFWLSAVPEDSTDMCDDRPTQASKIAQTTNSPCDTTPQSPAQYAQPSNMFDPSEKRNAASINQRGGSKSPTEGSMTAPYGHFVTNLMLGNISQPRFHEDLSCSSDAPAVRGIYAEGPFRHVDSKPQYDARMNNVHMCQLSGPSKSIGEHNRTSVVASTIRHGSYGVDQHDASRAVKSPMQHQNTIASNSDQYKSNELFKINEMSVTGTKFTATYQQPWSKLYQYPPPVGNAMIASTPDCSANLAFSSNMHQITPDAMSNDTTSTIDDLSTVAMAGCYLKTDTLSSSLGETSQNNGDSAVVVVDRKVPPHYRKKGTRKHNRNLATVPITKDTKSKKSKSTCTSTVTKPLTPYNFFFRFERHRLLQRINEIEDKTVIANLRDAELMSFLDQYVGGGGGDDDHFAWTVENSVEQQRQLLQEQWGRDTSIKRVHCKSHGRFDFSTLTRHIAAQWRALPVTAKDVFRAISAQDYQRYNREKLQMTLT